MSIPDRKYLPALLPLILIAACGEPSQPVVEESGAAPVATIEIDNPSAFQRADEAMRLDLDSLGIAAGGAWMVTSAEDELPSQLSDTDGDGTADALLFVADYAPAGTRTVDIVSGAPAAPARRTQAEVSIKTGGRWEGQVYRGGEFVNVEEIALPPQYTDHSEFIRYEGPGIESDRVGYRIYLDWRNGFDIFGKASSAMVLQDVGLDGYESYHEPADWGMDILKVGDAVGIGGYGYWDGERIVRVSETAGRAARIVENGALSSTLQISYDGWQVAGTTTDLRALLTVTAGSRLVHTRLDLSGGLANIAIGIVRHPEAELLLADVGAGANAWTYVGTWGPQSIDGTDLGMALFFRESARQVQTADEHNVVSVLQPVDGRVEYYFAAAWSGEPGGIESRSGFVEWLLRETERLNMPLRTRFRTAVSQ